MNINEIKQFVEFIANKSPEGSNPTPSQFNLLAWRALTEKVAELIGGVKDYQPGVPIPRQGFQASRKITEDLRILLERRTFSVATGGTFKIPDGQTVNDINTQLAPRLLYISSLRYRYITPKTDGGYKAREVNLDELRDSEVGTVLSSSMTPPTKRYPKFVEYSDFIQVYPTDLASVILTYLREPKRPQWAFTLDNNRPVYNASQSVDIELPDTTHNDIVMRILSYIGVHIREPQLAQYSEMMKQTTP